MIDLTTIILPYNEELNITDCINSIKSISSRIIVVDSYSTDRTVEIAKKMGAEIFYKEYISISDKLQYAFKNTNIKTKWVLRLDADERLTENSAKEVNNLCLKHHETNINGIVLRFEVNFLGRKLKHGGIYPFRKMVLFCSF